MSLGGLVYRQIKIRMDSTQHTRRGAKHKKTVHAQTGSEANGPPIYTSTAEKHHPSSHKESFALEPLMRRHPSPVRSRSQWREREREAFLGCRTQPTVDYSHPRETLAVTNAFLFPALRALSQGSPARAQRFAPCGRSNLPA